MISNHDHFKIVCSECSDIIAQCRCPAFYKNVQFQVCLNCAANDVEAKSEEAMPAFAAGEMYTQVTYDDPRRINELNCRIDYIMHGTLFCTVFADIHEEAQFDADTGIRHDKRAYLIEKRKQND